MKPDTEREFMLTDSCAWEANRQAGTRSAHTIEVVDIATGQTRHIKSGSIIRFVEGQISKEPTQEDYNQYHDDRDRKRALESMGITVLEINADPKDLL